MSDPRRPTALACATRALVLGVAALASLAADGRAQAPCVGDRVPRPRPDARWPAPLDRVVTVGGEGLPLRDALDRLAAAARLRLSYSSDLLPAGRAACLARGTWATGDALVALLAGSELTPVVAGAEQVVLAPGRSAVVADATPAIARATGHLARVLVTGSATGAAERTSPFALTVVDGRSLGREGTRAVSDALDGAVPGIWLWPQSPVAALARWGSIRGASSFGVSVPKVYIDGVEVANPLLLTRLDPAQVERVEIIRGPQGAALYGADAISGVVQIVTRPGGTDAPGDAELRTSAGSVGSAWADGVVVQEHGLSLRGGAAGRSVAFGATASAVGAFVPGAGARRATANLAARRVGTLTALTATARLDLSDADVPASPLLASSAAARALAGDSAGAQRVRQYGLGLTATRQLAAAWTGTLVAGVDGYRLAGLSAEGMPLLSATDSALRAARGGADRMTLRLGATRRIGDAERDGATLTLALEHSTAREGSNGAGAQIAPRLATPAAQQGNGGSGSGRMSGDDDTARDSVAVRGVGEAGTSWWSNTGLLAQAQAGVGGWAYVNGGARLERLDGPAGSELALLPMLGASVVRDAGLVTTKLRAAYGRGIRPARTVARGATWTGGRVPDALTALAPESQAGVEVGADLVAEARRSGEGAGAPMRLALHVTRFDQRVSGLVQPVAVVVPAEMHEGHGRGWASRVQYQLQNVGAITNRGWELEGSGSAGPLSLGATFTRVESRVARLANGYRGDLRPGDRMLEVPARTLGLTAGWTSARWHGGLTLARAMDWVNYDGLALRLALAGDSSATPTAPVGPALRAWWRDYPGETRLGARLSLALGRRSWLTLSGDNLLGHQTGEPDDLTVLPGRTVMVGVRANF